MSFSWREVVAKLFFFFKQKTAYEMGWNAINQLSREDYSWNGGEPNVFYVRRNGRYFDASGISGLDCALDSSAFAVRDLDGDGNLDLILKSRMAPQVQAFRNQCAGGRNSIAVRLKGTKSNRDGVGARVEADCVVRFLQAGSGYLSQNTKTLHFGLGDAGAVSTLRIVWPSGARQEFHDLAAGYRYDITEGFAELTKEAFAPRGVPAAAAAIAPAPDNQPRTHDTWLLEPVPLPDKRKGPGLLYVGSREKPSFAGHVEVVDLQRESADVAAADSSFPRDLFCWGTAFVPRLLELIVARSRDPKLLHP